MYLLLRQILQMLAQLAREGGAKDVELLVCAISACAPSGGGPAPPGSPPDLQPADRVYVKQPIQWKVTSEREVQDIVWIMLRTVFEDVVDEEPLRRLGHSSYRADFGLPRLGLLVEIKYARTASEFKKIVDDHVIPQGL